MSDSTALVLWFLNNSLLSLLQGGFTWFNLAPKFNKYLTLFLSTVPLAFLAVSQKFIHFIAPSFLVILGLGYYFISSAVLYKDKLKTKIFVSVAIFTLQSCGSMFMVNILSFIGIDPSSNEANAAMTPYMLVHVFIFIIFTYFRKRKGLKATLNTRTMIACIIFLVGQLMLLNTSCILFMHSDWESENLIFSILRDRDRTAVLAFSICAVFSILSDIVLFYVMLNSAQNEKLKEDLKMREYQNAVNLEYYKNIEENSTKARKIRHDLANIVQTAYEIVEGGTDTDRETAKKMLDQLTSEVSDVRIEKFCQNTLVNSIASNKASLCRENGIFYDFDLRVPQETEIEEIDLCKAYVNILDNAINAASAGKDGYVKVSSFIDSQDGFLYIKSENSLFPDYKNRKAPQNSEHGYGLKILEDTARKYSGKLITDVKSDTFTVLLTMKMSGNVA